MKCISRVAAATLLLIGATAPAQAQDAAALQARSIAATAKFSR